MGTPEYFPFYKADVTKIESQRQLLLIMISITLGRTQTQTYNLAVRTAVAEDAKTFIIQLTKTESARQDGAQI